MTKDAKLEYVGSESSSLSRVTSKKNWHAPKLVEVDYSETQSGFGVESGGDAGTGYS